MSLEAKISSLKKPFLSLVLGSSLYLTGCTSMNMDNFASMALGPVLGANSQLQAVQGNINAALALQAASEIAQNDFQSKIAESEFRKKAESEGYVSLGNLKVKKKTRIEEDMEYWNQSFMLIKWTDFDSDNSMNYDKREFRFRPSENFDYDSKIVLTVNGRKYGGKKIRGSLSPLESDNKVIIGDKEWSYITPLKEEETANQEIVGTIGVSDMKKYYLENNVPLTSNVPIIFELYVDGELGPSETLKININFD